MSTRRSRIVKNLQEEVESIFSQDESDEECKVLIDENQKLLGTPSKGGNFLEVSTPKASQSVLQDIQTPRRSCRKSVKPAQDYDEIISHSTRYSTRSAKKNAIENDDNENAQPKWTPAKVGRVSEKRTRKLKRTGKKSEQKNKAETVEGDTVNTKEVTEKMEPLKDKFEKINMVNRTDECIMQEKQVDVVENMQSFNLKLENINNHKNSKGSSLEKETEEHSETTSGSTDKSEHGEICVIYENNIGNLDVKVDMENKPSTSVSSEDEDSFGCYLKSKIGNISDLGLNPIKEDEIEDINVDNQTPSSLEEMPSIVTCHNEEAIENPTQIGKLNETFEADKNEDIDKCLKQNEDIMETLQLSDDEFETPKKSTQIILTDTNGQNITLLSSNKKASHITAITPSAHKLINKLPSTPKHVSIKAKLPITPKAISARIGCTPKQAKKINRLPTPYKNKNFIYESEETFAGAPSNSLSNISFISTTTLGPKEIVLRGIRKRSLSLCINEEQRKNLCNVSLSTQKQNRTVSFNSPANQTTKIDDLDMIIAKSLQKQKFGVTESTKKYVTTRRKRSISLDDSIMSASIASRLPRPVPGQIARKVQNSTLSKTLKRTKLPNFAAIHEKRFNQMENLVDHVSRKQERSKILINSATKLLTVSAQKNAILSKNKENISGTKPNAAKKIDLNTKSQKIEKSKLYTKPPTQKKPAFNLSTTLNVKPTTSASNFVEKANTSHFNNEKVTSSMQRHMELFKAQSPSTRRGLAKRKNEAILKGVRSNRRFELQMQHRRNLQQ